MDIRPPQQQLEDALSRVNGGYARMRRGGYGGLGSLDPNFMNQGGQGGGAMGGQKMPWQT